MLAHELVGLISNCFVMQRHLASEINFDDLFHLLLEVADCFGARGIVTVLSTNFAFGTARNTLTIDRLGFSSLLDTAC